MTVSMEANGTTTGLDKPVACLATRAGGADQDNGGRGTFSTSNPRSEVEG